MKRLSGIISLLLVFSMLFSFASCKGNEKVSQSELKIGMIYNYAVTANNVFDAYHRDGIEAAADKLSLDKKTQIVSKNVKGTDKNAETVIREAATEGCMVIFALSQEYADACEKLATEFPDIKFICYASTKTNDTNLTSFFAKIYEAEFLAGIAAGLKSKANAVCYIAPQSKLDSEVSLCVNAFARGIIVSNPNVKPYVYVTNTDKNWFDLSVEPSYAEYVIKRTKCDVIAQYAATDLIPNSAAKSKVYSLGFGSDMKSSAPDYFMFSPVWNWSVYYTKILGDIINGTFTTAPYLGGIKEGVVGISTMNETTCDNNITTGVNTYLEKFKSTEGYDVFSVEVKDSFSELKLAADADYTYEQLVSGIDYYIFGIDEII